MSSSSSLGRSLLLFLLTLVLILQSTVIKAEFGDLVSSPEDDPVCPVTTTCKVVCVENITACPTPACGAGLQLCPDGRCMDVCTGYHLKNPCTHDCANLACPKVDDAFEACEEKYSDFYDAAETCAEQAVKAESTVKMRPAVAAFLGGWIGLVTICLLLYCQVNRCSRHEQHKMEGGQYQAGYSHHIVGTIMYLWVVATIWAFQIVLLSLSIVYYANQNTSTQWQSMWYDDEESILLDFEIVWVVGFLWSFWMKWPHSLRAVFWKRVPLSQATVVAVWTPKAPDKAHVNFNSQGVACVRGCLKGVWKVFNTFLTGLFGLDSNANGTWTYCQVQAEDADGQKFFVHNFRRYNLSPDDDQFLPSAWNLTSVNKQGLSQADVYMRTKTCGRNIIPMENPTLTQVLVKEFTQPYYTYQNFIMWSWVPLWYYYMAIVQSSVIIIGGVMVALFQLRNEQSLYKLTHVEGTVQVLRDGNYQSISPADLVPGDIVMVEPGLTYCDCVLVQSAGVLVDESALTGEANPIAKTAIEDINEFERGLDPLKAKRNLIQAGCTVLEAEAGHNQAVVTHTGSYTTKGELLRNIFSYQRHPFKFDKEVSVVILILVIYGFIGFWIVFYNLSHSPVYGWFYGIYAVSSVMPPLLPTVFTVSVGVSDHRLMEKNIACTNSEEILVAGKVTRAFFDKTGTLTKQGLEFISARCGKTWSNDKAEGTKHISTEMALCIATCHSLSRSQQTGEFIGNPVDRTMFAAIGADIVPNQDGHVVIVRESNGNQAEIVRHFDFDHHRMTQSVIVKSGGKLYAFVKGSGESMGRICSTDLPPDFNNTLRASARAGIYQITMAVKELDAGLTPTQIQGMARDDIERDLGFLGVINFKNLLREETPDVIGQLEKGDVRCVMVTGDSVLTGIRIARESGIIEPGCQVLCATELDSEGRYPVWLDEDDNPTALPGNLSATPTELAISGNVFEALCKSDPEAAEEWAEHIRVYGRCTPMHKVDVVTRFVDRSYITLFCGDGGNDCGALKTAHVGVALSDAEASIVAPFTSLDKTPTSVVDVLKEGRCTLASALASYKFMIMYGQLVFSTDISNSAFHIMLPEWCWVFIDGIWAIGLGFTLPLSKPAHELAPSRPTSSLLGLQTMSSALGVLFIHYVYYIIALAVLFTRDWYECRQWEGDDISNVLWIGDNYETETMFLVVGYQFISTAMTYNFGYEWRSSWCSNMYFVAFVAAISFIHFYIMLYPGYLSCLFRVNCDNDHVLRSVAQFELVAIQNAWNTTVMPSAYRFALLFIVIANTLSVMGWDYWVVNGTRQRHSRKKQMEKFISVADKPLVEEDNELL